MRKYPRITLQLCLRFVLFSACLTLLLIFTVARESASAANQTNSVHWNLNKDDIPLLSLPEPLNRDLDLSLTYSIDQFELPLLQPLNYNDQSHSYSLMLIARDESESLAGSGLRRTVFVNFVSAGSGEFQSQTSALRLKEIGGVKVLSAGKGTELSFYRFADGELHCRVIKDGLGHSISLSYANNGSIDVIGDNAGRTIAFSYNGERLNAITQTWDVEAKQFKQTWVVGDDVRYAHRVANTAVPVGATFRVPVNPAPLKHIPSNAMKQVYTRDMAVSDAALAKIFGGPGAVAAANGFEPGKLSYPYPLYRGDLMSDTGRVLRGHLSFAMHLYGSADGTADTGIYIPAGFTSHSGEPTKTDAVLTFYYPRLGNLTDVTLAVFHVKDFQFSYEGERVRIGNIGGRGGSIASYKHAHLEFYRGNTGLPALARRIALRIDPTKVF